MGIFQFLKTFGKEKFNDIGDSIAQKIVSWDPETATQAEIEEMIKELDRITTEAGKAKAEFDREKAEAEAAQRNYDRYMSAAELLNKQLEEAQSSGSNSKAVELSGSLDKIIHDLENLRPEVEREAREAGEAKSYYEEIKQLAETTAQKVKAARSQLEQAKRDMKRAEIDKERAKSRAEKAEQLAGLKSQTSSLGVALAAMNKQAEEARAIASASDMKAKLLSPEKTSADQNIEAALKAVSGQPVLEGKNFSDRLAALRRD